MDNLPPSDKIRIAHDDTLKVMVVNHEHAARDIVVYMNTDKGVAKVEYTQDEFLQFYAIIAKAAGRIRVANQYGGIRKLLEQQREHRQMERQKEKEKAKLRQQKAS